MPEFHALLEGYKRFREDSYPKQRARYDALAKEGQAPPIMVISCCDSRVDPATIFDTSPGQMFALRNVANLVPPYDDTGGLHGSSAAIEFGVTGLNVKHIVVLGHGQCGGISAALQGGELGLPGYTFIDEWMSIITEARDQVITDAPANPQRALELEAIKLSIENLRSFPFIAEREQRGEIKLHGAWYAIGEATLFTLDEATGAFNAVE
ncbi:carbonic anhydrase [Parasphingorhabdus litoris]|uniref:carbonic anhydrase n=1 Tax=Parasphingorhabdus litoris TaxID=394733 RepID=A0ABN1ARE6_9SPHN|nr:carbonic anhydrase [Parasphingorhabdus litoris]